MIELSGIRKTLGGRRVLDGVDLRVAAGECVVLTGDSGAGKSTLLRIVAGLEAAEDGHVKLRGVDVATMAPHERRLGVQFQESALWPHLTLEENVAFSGKAAKGRALQCLERAGLRELAGRRPGDVSGGEARRAALARALAAQCDILLLDEPLTQLQPAARLEMAAWIREEQRAAGAACLWVAHDAEEAALLTPRIYVLAGGRLTERESVER
ncbi:MAG: ATP-binding cassette domain-containing protein [Acidobacteria bacterium]|nr:ATP-binding cassette domain-containing protein [Acidobacteriota bacterium]